MEDEHAVAAPELARILGVSAETIRRHAALGEIPGFKVGRQWRFWPSQVREHLQFEAEQRDPWGRSPASRRALDREARSRNRAG